MIIKNKFKEVKDELSNLFYHYPAFARSSSAALNPNSIPVFVFHSIVHDHFEKQLRYLKKNGYRSITCDLFYEYLAFRERIPPRTIMLTVDDGRESVKKFGFQLIQKYEMPTVIFAIPGLMPENALKKNKEINSESLLSWQDAQKMEISPLIDFQSHSLYHRRIFTGKRIVGFLDKASFSYGYERVLPIDMENIITQQDLSAWYGMPIYENDSLFSNKLPYQDDVNLRNACIAHYQEISKGSFVCLSASLDVQRKMGKFAREYQKKTHLRDSFLTPTEHESLMLQDLSESKRILEKRLRKKVNHFCFPYAVHSSAAIRIASKCGYMTQYCGVIKGKEENIPGSDLSCCVRLKNDFIFRLPGNGRRSLLSIIILKIIRRLKGKTGY